MELDEYGHEYQPRTAIKSQVLADFIVDFTCELQMQTERELIWRSYGHFMLTVLAIQKELGWEVFLHSLRGTRLKGLYGVSSRQLTIR